MSEKSTKEDPRKEITSGFLTAILGSEVTAVPVKPGKTSDKPAKDPDPKPVQKTEDDGAAEASTEPEEGEGEKPTAEPEAPKPLTAEQITQAAAEGAARGMLAATAPKEKPNAAAKEPDYPKQYEDEVEVLETLRRTNPAKYGNIKQALIDADKREEEYIATWERKNPGEAFDSSDEAHASFYSGINVPIAPKDLEHAKSVLADNRARAVAREEVNRAKANDELERARQQVPTQASSITGRIMLDAIKDISGEEIDPASETALEELREKDPVLVEVVMEEAPGYQAAIRAALEVGHRLQEYNQHDPAHRKVAHAVGEIHRTLSALPPEKLVRVDEGRRLQYVPPDRFDRLSQADRARAWTITPADVVAWIRTEAKAVLKAKYDRWSKVSGRTPATESSQDDQKTTAAQNPQSTARTASTFVPGSGRSGPAIDELGKKTVVANGKYGSFLKNAIGG